MDLCEARISPSMEGQLVARLAYGDAGRGPGKSEGWSVMDQKDLNSKIRGIELS